MIHRWSRCGSFVHTADVPHNFEAFMFHTRIRQLYRCLFTTHIRREAEVVDPLPSCDTQQQTLISTSIPLLEPSSLSVLSVATDEGNKEQEITTSQREEIKISDNNSNNKNNSKTVFTYTSSKASTEHDDGKLNNCESNCDKLVSNNDIRCTTSSKCTGVHVNEEVYSQMLQSTNIVAFAQHIAAFLREIPELCGILPVPFKVLEHCYSLALNAPARTRRSSAQTALEVSKQVRLLESNLLSKQEQAMLDLYFARLHANAGHWHKAKNLIHCSDVIDCKTKQEFEENLVRQEKCETIVAQWERTPHLISTHDVCYAVTHLADWEIAFYLVNQYESYSHEVNHARSALLARADVSTNMTWQNHYKYFRALPRGEQKYSIARGLIRRIPFSDSDYILIVSDVLQHTALTMSSATLARWLYNAQRRQNWCFAIALGCAARYYDVVLPWIQYLSSPKPSSWSSLSGKDANVACAEQHQETWHMKRRQYKTRYIIPAELINYEKTLTELRRAAILLDVADKQWCCEYNDTNTQQKRENESEVNTIVKENANVLTRRKKPYEEHCELEQLDASVENIINVNTNTNNNNNNNNSNNKSESNAHKRNVEKMDEREVEQAKACALTTEKVSLDDNAPFEVCLAHALHGDWRRVMHISSAMADRRLRALCNAMITFTNTHNAHNNVHSKDRLVKFENNSSNSNNNDDIKSSSDKEYKVEAKVVKGKECFYFDSTFFSSVVFRHARRSAQEHFLQSIPPSEYAHYTDNNVLRLSLLPMQSNESLPSFLSEASSDNLLWKASQGCFSAQNATNTRGKQNNDSFMSIHDKLLCLPTRVSNRKECAELFRFIYSEMKESRSSHLKATMSDIAYCRIIAFCFAAMGPALLSTHSTEEFSLPLNVLKTASLLQVRLDATMTVQLASSIPSPVLDKHVEVLGMLCDSLLLLGRWQEVLSLYWRVNRKRHIAKAPMRTTTTKAGWNSNTNKRNGKDCHELLPSHATYSNLQHKRFIELQDVVAKAAFYCHTNKKEYNKFVQYVQETHSSTRISQSIFDLVEGNVRRVCYELEQVERTLQPVHHNRLSKADDKPQERLDNNDNTSASSEEQGKKWHVRQELLSAAFCLLHREDDLRRVLRAISQSHVAAVDLNSHGLQRLLRVLPTNVAVEALVEYARHTHPIHTHWITSLMSRHDIGVREVYELSTLQPYACDVQYIHLAVCALREHNVHKMFYNVYRYFCASFLSASSTFRLSSSASHNSITRTPSLRNLTLLLRSAVEDDTILTHALQSYKAECTFINKVDNNVDNNNNTRMANTNEINNRNSSNIESKKRINEGSYDDIAHANMIDNTSHTSMYLLFNTLSECKELSFSFHGSRRLLLPALHYSSTLHAILLAGAMHHLLGKCVQIPIPASFTSRLLKSSCTANVDWTVSWFFFRALHHPTRSERQLIVQSLNSVEWTDKIDTVVSYALLNWREFLFYAPEQVVVWCNTRLGKSKWQVSLELSELFAAMESSYISAKQAATTTNTKNVIGGSEECSENIENSNSNDNNKGSGTENTEKCEVDAELNDAAWMQNDAFAMVQELIRDWAHHECTKAIACLERIGHTYPNVEEHYAQIMDNYTCINSETKINNNDKNNKNGNNGNGKCVCKVYSKDAKAIQCAQRVLKIIRDHQSNCFPPQEHNITNEEETSNCERTEITSNSEITTQTENETANMNNEPIHHEQEEHRHIHLSSSIESVSQ